MNYLSKTSIRRPILATMVFCVLLAFSFLAMMNLKMDLMPNMNIPVAIVMTTYNGAGPEEMENLITKPVESSMGTVQGIDTITSTSSNGSSIVVVRFQDNVDIDMAALDMREKIDMIKGSLPDDASDPMVMKIDINNMSSIMIAMTSENLSLVELKTLAEDKVSDRLERREGVASVSVSGGLSKEITVTLEEDKMRGYGITESTVRALLAAENVNIPTGTAKQGTKKMQVRVKGEFESLEDIRTLPLTTRTGQTVYLRDIATVEEAFSEQSSSVYVKDLPGVILSIQKQSTANTVNVSDSVLKELNSLKRDYSNLSLAVIYDPADYIRDSISNVFSSLLQGMALSVIILYIFLRNWRSTLIISSAMPLSVIITIGLMYFTGITINLISLSGLTLGVGMLVDNSVVVLESIYRKLEEGDTPLTAALEGAREVGTSVTASTITTVAVFLPITFVGGLVAQIFNDLSFTISFSLIASLFVSMTFVPMCCSLFLRLEHVTGSHKRNNIFTRFLDRIGRAIVNLEQGYKKLLTICLEKRKTTVLVAIAFIIGTAVVLPSLGMEFMPSMDQSMIQISVEMPKGTLLNETEKVALTVMERVMVEPEIDNIEMMVGGGGISLSGSSTDNATIIVVLTSRKERSRSSEEVAAAMRKNVTDIPGYDKITVSASSGMGSMGSSSEIEVYIKGSDNDMLVEISNDVKRLIMEVDGTRDVATSAEDTTPQATVKIDRNKAASYGISPASITSYVSTAIAGSKATTFKVNDTEYDVMLRQDKDKLEYIVDIENILIPTATGVNVPLSELCSIVVENMPQSITRDNQQKYVSVSASLDGRDLNSVSGDIEARMKTYPMPDGYYYEFAGSQSQMTEAFANLGFALLVAILLLFMIMAAQFESFLNPLVVMFSIPIACTGGLFGLFVTRQTITVTSFLGLIMLVGVVVNNAIVLIDYTNLLRRERNYEIKPALIKAGPTRLRPILMSTLTTVVAMIPLALGLGDGAEMNQGLAIVSIFGLSLSTLVTLLVIPVIYMAFDNWKMNLRKWRNRNKGETEAVTVSN